ncbi:hypothetical protein V2A60_006272 [Cordyceps javanica]
MLASAAIIDSIRKDERRKELDKQLEEARQELAALKEQGKLLHSLSGTNADGLTPKQKDILWQAMKQIYNERPYGKNLRFPATLTASRVTECLLKDYYDCPSPPVLRQGSHLDYAALEQAIVVESEKTSSRARTETHLRHETSQFLNLVNALLKEADRMDRTDKESASFKRARNLLSHNHTGYTFRSLDPQAARNMTQELNMKDGLSSLIRLLNSTGILLEPSSFMHKRDPGRTRVLQLESLWKEYVKMRKMTIAIESKLLNADHPQEFREKCAPHVVASALGQSERLSREIIKLLPVQKQLIDEQERVDQPVSTFVKAEMSPDRGIAAAQVMAFDRELPVSWSRQLAVRSHYMAEHIGVTSV